MEKKKKEVETENRKNRIIARKLNEVINLMRERNELYEVRMVNELQNETKRIEQMKEELELFLIYETHTQKEKNRHRITDLNNVICWIEEEQEKYKL